MRIVFLGDSLTEGVTGASYLRVLKRLVADDPGLRDVKLINAGRGGDTVFQVARRVTHDVVPHTPDWVVVFVGVNDCRTWYAHSAFPPTRATLGSAYYFLRRKGIWRAVTPRRYEAALRTLVDDLRGRTPARIALCTPATASEGHDARAERMLDAYAAVVRAVAAERGCALIDARAVFLAAQTSPKDADSNNPGDDVYHLTCDGVHLSDAGAALVGGVIHDWLLTL
jgi:lysophospholipase L1-like esterase